MKKYMIFSCHKADCDDFVNGEKFESAVNELDDKNKTNGVFVAERQGGIAFNFPKFNFATTLKQVIHSVFTDYALADTEIPVIIELYFDNNSYFVLKINKTIYKIYKYSKKENLKNPFHKPIP